MAGVSGIGGGGGPGKIPPHGNDDDKKSGSASFGGHNIVYGDGNHSRSSSSSSDSSIEERTRMLMESGFQVLTPEEVEETQRSSISPEGTSKPGFFSRIWSAVKGIFTGGKKSEETQKPMEISSPIIPGYKQHGVRLPEARAMQAYWNQSSQDSSSIDSTDTTIEVDTGDTDVTDVTDEVPVGRLVDIDTEDSSRASTSSVRSGASGLAARVRGWWDYATRKQESPADGVTGMTLGELVDMVRTYDRMIAETDNKKEQKEFTKYRDAYQARVNEMLSAGASSLTDRFNPLDDSIDTSRSSSKKYNDGVGEAVFLDMDTDLSSVFEEVLLDDVEKGDDADSILGDISPEAKRVLEEANKLRLQFDAGISESVTPTLRERIKAALEKLRQGIINILTIIKLNLVALARLVRKGLRSLGELVKRCCVRKHGHYSFLPGDQEYAEEVARFIQKHTESDDPYDPGTLIIPDSMVNAWVNGQPEVVYITDVRGILGHEIVRTRVNDREGMYEIIGASWLPYGNTGYEDMRPVLPDNHPNDTDYENMAGRPDPEGLYTRVNRNRNIGGSIYDKIRGSRRKKDEEHIYDLPSLQNRMSIKRGDDDNNIYDMPRPGADGTPISSSRRGTQDNVYDAPRTGPEIFNQIYDDGYMVPDDQLGFALGVTPGFGNGVGAVSFAEQIDNLIEETRMRAEGATNRGPLPSVPVPPIFDPRANRPLPPRPEGPYDPNTNRPLPVPPPLQNPPETPYGSGRMMQMMRLVQERAKIFRDQRKDKQ
ncbi:MULTISPECIES: hypothetical protein [Chlamydia]|uniref:Uncharacterized protein n=1 Tax=Chlamydia crocodili TaxID=2766982 RepID=A0ABX8CGB4_9CHLA|nr:hypothetical protein [Chlamydia crocodili]QVE48820.1 hypothetical protein H9Q19_03815 [Chlamydia crocodili]